MAQSTRPDSLPECDTPGCPNTATKRVQHTGHGVFAVNNLCDECVDWLEDVPNDNILSTTPLEEVNETGDPDPFCLIRECERTPDEGDFFCDHHSPSSTATTFAIR